MAGPFNVDLTAIGIPKVNLADEDTYEVVI
jgi:hypothetical protein